MSEWGSNVLYNPKKLGLTIIYQIDHGESYEFDLAVLWKDKDDRFLFGHDAGCSYPTPFEDYTDDMLEVITSVDDLRRLLDQWSKDDDGKEAMVSAYLNAGGTR